MGREGCNQSQPRRLFVTAQLTLALAACKDSMPRLYQAVDDFARCNGLDAETVQAAQLALEETVLNVIVHGYQERPEKTVLVRILLLENELLLEVEDAAPPFNPLEQSEANVAVPLEERREGGLGIFLVRRVMDRVQYSYAAGKNHLAMGKKIAH